MSVSGVEYRNLISAYKIGLDMVLAVGQKQTDAEAK